LRTLYLLRHAKSSWSNADLPDRDRPLNARGDEAARSMAAYMAGAGVRPALVLCSTALRARATLEPLRAAFGDDVDVWTEDGLHGADAGELLRYVQRLPPAVPSAMVIAHNPGLQDLALELAGAGDRGALRRLTQKFPTGALATLTLPETWAALAPGTATLTALVVPRELPSP
jgi:phosphohistidine phosphatase